MMLRTACRFLSVLLFIFLFFSTPGAEEDNNSSFQQPPSVVVSVIRTGHISPQSDFVGTVYYREVSDVASETTGKVDKVHFEEGQRTKKDFILVELSFDLLKNLSMPPGQSMSRYYQILRRQKKIFSGPIISSVKICSRNSPTTTGFLQ